MTTLSYPFRFTPSGTVATVSENIPTIREQIQMLLSTGFGTRMRMRGYGSSLPNLLFGADQLVVDDVRKEIGEAIQRWVPRARLRSLSVSVIPETGGAYIFVEFSDAVEKNGGIHALEMSLGTPIEEHEL